MRNKKFNKELLKEEVKRFQQINEFKFYEDDNEEQDLILGDRTMAEEEEIDAEADVEGGEEDVEQQTSDDIFAADGDDSEEPPAEDEEPAEDVFGDEEGFGGDEGEFGEEPEMDAEPDPMDDAVELDVTELVKGSEEAKASADAANAKIGQLMGMVNKLEGQLDGMNQISQKIDGLEAEIEKRNPTEDEKLEMRSLDSYPYNLKLTDFWSNQTDQYDVMGTEDKEEEYELNRDSIDNDYVETDVRDSFDIDLSSEEDM